MEKFYVTSRPKKPSQKFSTKFTRSILDLTSSFLASQEFTHSATKGTEREKALIEFFEENLPENFGVGTGEVVDCFGKTSPQLDIIIFDRFKTFKLYDGDSVIIPAEALLASVEVKSNLNINEINKSIEAAKKLKKLEPFKRRVKNGMRDGSKPLSKFYTRYFHCLFAYNTDISKDEWAKKEYLRLSTAVDNSIYEYSGIDRLYENNRGIINPLTGMGIDDETPSVMSLMYLFMHIYNFLERENNRRRPVPIELYAGRQSAGWENLKE